jgi:hypothetical protein
MYHHVKKLMYTVNIEEPDPRFGRMLLERFGVSTRRPKEEKAQAWTRTPRTVHKRWRKKGNRRHERQG